MSLKWFAAAPLFLFASLCARAEGPTLRLNNPETVITAPTEVSVDLVMPNDPDQEGVAALIVIEYDPAIVTLSNPKAAHPALWNDFTVFAAPDAHQLRILMLTNGFQPGPTTTGPLLKATATPVGASADLSICTTLRLVGGAYGQELTCNLAIYRPSTNDYDSLWVPSSCGPLGPIYVPPAVPDTTTEGTGDTTTTEDTDGTTNDGSTGPTDVTDPCAPDILVAIQALRYASGLDEVTWETNVADYDTNGDDLITLSDALRALHPPCPPTISVAPYPYNAQTRTGCPYPSIQVSLEYSSTVPVQFRIQRKVAESYDWLTVGTVQGEIGTHTYQWEDLFLAGSKQYTYRAQTVLGGGTSQAFGGPFSSEASAVSLAGINWGYATGPLDITDPRSWFPEVIGPDALDEAPQDQPTGEDIMWWQTGVYDDETGAVSVIPFNPNQPQVSHKPSEEVGCSDPLRCEEEDGVRPYSFIHDGRERATVARWPYSAICRIVVRYSDGTWGHGTGTIVDPARRFVLTAGHVLVRKSNKNKPDHPPKVWVLPGAYTDPREDLLKGYPYTGSRLYSMGGVAHTEKRWFYNQYDTNFDQRNDIAVLKLGGGNYRGYASYLGVGGYADADQNIGKSFTMAGYPFDDYKSGGWTMYNGSGRTSSWYSPRLFYGKRIVRTDLDANNGDSGAPL